MTHTPDSAGPSLGGPAKEQHSRVKSAEDFDLVIGFLGFWALVLLVITVAAELTAQPALGWALGLLAVLLALWGMLRLRRRLPARTSRRIT
ncbi:hypothetical protein [Arthrobacter sp. FW306-2-2C-D06B]|uniref:hypothetical protein n=1 Tax=Arthrobacter sp. FW306-2-2C-D06B TaxID=2879618 RepID=UPI001F1D56AD|nr:hypothetical protein [Arthrobacter sp. FW306-2-2C-D06B]UKA59069.1 hypothetical protein LFT47_01555 [Arthrobacter sp. FW306-2-2C-D06B]